MTKIVELLIPYDNTKRRRSSGGTEDVEPAIDVPDNAEARVTTTLYGKRSKSRGAEVSYPSLVLVGLTVELERDYEETRR